MSITASKTATIPSRPRSRDRRLSERFERDAVYSGPASSDDERGPSDRECGKADAQYHRDFCPSHISRVERYLDEENTGPGFGVVRFAAEPPVGTSVSEDDDSQLPAVHGNARDPSLRQPVSASRPDGRPILATPGPDLRRQLRSL